MAFDEYEAYVDDEGRLVLPSGLARQYGLTSGATIRIAANGGGLHLGLPATHLAKIYIEPTNRCNLECLTCMRNGWQEPLGQMADPTFSQIVEGLRAFSPPPNVFFGGLGEPLAHPRIVEMVRQAKALGSCVELITNGTLLTEALSLELIEAGLDALWVSLDGATPKSYRDVRLGAALPQVLANLGHFRTARWNKHSFFMEHLLKPKLGIVFVAMQRNIGDLPSVVRLSRELGACRVLVTNVLPYTRELQDEMLCGRALEGLARSSSSRFSVDVPEIDVNAGTRDTLHQLVVGSGLMRWPAGAPQPSGAQCPFIEQGTMAIRWDGNVSPCLGLLHDYKTYLYRFERSVRHYAVGSVTHQSLDAIWKAPEYLSFRNRVQKFDFSPCTLCGGCDFLKSNEEDCFGNSFPSCGGCLWAQGVIRCP